MSPLKSLFFLICFLGNGLSHTIQLGEIIVDTINYNSGYEKLH